MSELNHKLVSIILSIATIFLFSGTISPFIWAQSMSGGSSYNFTRDFTTGSTGDDVKALQQFLNSHGFQVSASGPGSSDNETRYFGEATKEALIQWQIANDVLPANGYFGPTSRATIVAMTDKPIESIVSQASQAAIQTDLSTQTDSGFPIRLKIPKIKLDSVVESVGLTSDGAMDVPKIPRDVAWFKIGPRPGENGTAVIDGHFGRWKNGEGSVFDNLYKLSKGDKLYVEDDKGAIITFVVRESRRYDPKADASAVFGSSDDKSHLNLITCEGEWNKVSKNYSQRLVVFTDKE